MKHSDSFPVSRTHPTVEVYESSGKQPKVYRCKACGGCLAGPAGLFTAHPKLAKGFLHDHWECTPTPPLTPGESRWLRKALRW